MWCEALDCGVVYLNCEKKNKGTVVCGQCFSNLLKNSQPTSWMKAKQRVLFKLTFAYMGL